VAVQEGQVASPGEVVSNLANNHLKGEDGLLSKHNCLVEMSQDSDI
jgi:hypothetical protein